jgi:VanZ family protein
MARHGNNRLELTLATLAYVAVIAYGTLFSTEAWRVPREFHFLVWEGLRIASRADMFENVLGYIPLGVLLALRLGLSTSRGVAVTVTLLAGALLSLSLEMIQVFVPSRDSSATDLLMNTIGTFVGAFGSALVDPRQASSRTLARIRNAWFRPGVVGNLGVGVVVLWIASQLSPFIPTIDVATVRQGLSSAWHTLRDPELLNLSQALTYACYLSALGFFWSTAAREDRAAVGMYALVVVAVLLSKPFFLGRELSLEALIGFSVSIPLIAILSRWSDRVRGAIGAMMLCAGFLVYEFTPAAGPFHDFNWVPFRGEITNTLNGLMGMTGLIWVFFTLGALIRVSSSRYQRRAYAVLGALGVVFLVGLCEWFQQRIPGRYGDITTVGIAMVGWVAAWRFPDKRNDLTPSASLKKRT